MRRVDGLACWVCAAGFAWGALAAKEGGGAADFDCAIEDGRATLVRYKGNAREVAIPETFGGVPVAKIGDNAFKANATLLRISIPDSVTHIGDFAFHFCESLRTVRMSRNIRYIGQYGFFHCKRLEEIAIPRKIHLDECAFTGCDSLGTLISGDGSQLLRIGADVREYTVPASIREVQPSAFEKSQVRRVFFEEGTAKIYRLAFANCKELTEIVLPKSLEFIQARSFEGNPLLKAVTFKGDRRRVERGPFRDSPNVTVYYDPSAQGWRPDADGKWTEHDVPLRPLTKVTSSPQLIAEIKAKRELEQLRGSSSSAQPGRAFTPLDETAAPPPEKPAKTDEQLAEECAKLKALWDIYKSNSEKIRNEFQPQFAALQEQYRKSLETLKATVQGRGDLAKTKAAIAEIERFGKMKSLPPEQDEKEIEEIKAFQAAYVKQFAALEKDMLSKLNFLTQKYEQALGKLQTDLVKEGKLDEATAVNEARERAKRTQ